MIGSAPLIAASGIEAQLALAVIAIVAVALSMIVSAHNESERRKVWAAIAERLGFEVRGADHLVGVLDESEVEVSIVTRGSGKNKRTYTRIQAIGGMPSGLTLGREGFFSSFSDDIRLGDAEFDSEVRVGGDEGLALAVLDEFMRSIVRGAIKNGWALVNGMWAIETSGRPKQELETFIKTAAGLTKATREAGSAIGSRLVARIRRDPDVGARKRSLAYLIDRYRDTESYRAALAVAKDDADVELRLMAASELRDARALASITTDVSHSASVRAAALDALVDTRDATSGGGAVGRLIDELEHGPSGMLTRALARALGRVEHPRAEAALLGLLESKDDQVVLAAIRSLGRVGSIAAVPYLTPLRDRFLAFAIESAGAAKDAILAIQARTGDAGAGALSLSDDHGGGLAVVADEAAAHEES